MGGLRKVGDEAALFEGAQGGGALLRSFREQGYFVVEGALSPEDCAGIEGEGAAVFERLRHRWVREYDARPSSSQETILVYRQQDIADDGSIRPDNEIVFRRIIFNLNYDFPILRRALRGQVFQWVFRLLEMRDPRYVGTSFLIKPRFEGHALPIAHQDSSIVFTRPESSVTLWLTLEEATVGNGCVWVLPGRHASIETYRRVDGGEEKRIEHALDGKWAMEDFVPVPVKGGSLLVMHGNLPHQHRPNLTDPPRSRVALLCCDMANEYPSSNFVARDPAMPFAGPFEDGLV